MKKFFLRNKEKEDYENLKPRNDLEIKSIDALDYAFKNKNIKNIAITGNYSSGKSSIIESYVKKKFNYFTKKKINTISLATFLGQKEDISVEGLEKYIIEQLYYSTYNNVLKNNKDKSTWLAIDLYLVVLAIVLVVRWDILYFYFLRKHFKLIIAVLFIVVTCLIIYGLKNILKYVYKVDKFALQIMDLNIEIGKEGNNNVINENMELIMKIFRRFKYKIIIFEDLDRFGKPIIFEHLRELNNVLNKNMNVKFVYLIKDDVFEEENRTKFFDYIYPVVPYISYTTSGEELYKLIEKYNLQNDLPRVFIQNLTVFVQDMRVLKNTLNEYRIYRVDLNKDGIDPQSLFAIILYKNVFSKDFSKLQMKEGNLYGIFNIKEKKITELKEGIDRYKKILENKDLEVAKEKDIFCRAVERVIEQDRAASAYSTNATLRNSNIANKSVDNVIKLDFEFLTDENTLMNGTAKSVLKFLEEKNPELFEMQKRIKEQESIEIEEIEEKIAEREEWLEDLKINEMKDLFLNEYITDDDLEVFNSDKGNNENIQKIKLIKYLLQQGYIDETYNRYIEKFHEGTISKRDNDFLGNCLIRKGNEFLDDIDNPEIIIKRLDIEEFKYNSILNLQILKALINYIDKAIGNEISIEEYNNLIDIRTANPNNDLKKILQKTRKFIETFVSKGNYFGNFKIAKQKLSNKEYGKFCAWLSNDEKAFRGIIKNFTDENMKNEAIKDLLSNSTISNVKNSLEFNIIKKYIEEKGIFLEDNQNDKIIQVIDEFEIKYQDLSIGYEKNSEVLTYSIENNSFEINKKNIEIIVRNILKIRYANIEDFMKRNYSVIKNDDNVFKYINSNINIYFESIYLKYEVSKNDAEDIVLLLNNEKLSLEDKLEIIKRESKVINEADVTRVGIIKKLSDINDTELFNELLENSLILMSYTNINCFFKNMINIKIPEDITEDEKEDIKQKIKTEKEILVRFINKYGQILKEDSNKENSSELFLYICLENGIGDEIFETIVKSFDRSFKNTGYRIFEELSQNKRRILIENKKILFNDDMYNKIRQLGGEDFIIYTSLYVDKIKWNISKFDFDDFEIVAIINDSKRFHWTFRKNVLLSLNNYDIYDFNETNANSIARVILDKEWLPDFSRGQLKSFIINVGENNKIRLLNEYFSKLEKEDIEEIFETSLKDYERIILNKKRPDYKYSLELEKLIKKLQNIYNIEYDVQKGRIYIKGTIR